MLGLRRECAENCRSAGPGSWHNVVSAGGWGRGVIMEFLFFLVLVAIWVVRYLINREQKDDTGWRPPTPRRRIGAGEPPGRSRTQTAPAHSLTEALARAEARREHDQRDEVELRYEAVDDREDRQPGEPIVEHLADWEPVTEESVAEEPVTEHRADGEPATEDSVAEEPVAAEPAPEESVAEPVATATSSAAGYASPGAAYSSSVYIPTSVYSTGYTSTSVYESGTSILSPDSGGEETQDEEGDDDSSR